MAKAKQIIREIGRDVGRGLARAGKATVGGLAQVACKATYPILGNLSSNLQKRIEKTLGSEFYNAIDASYTSVFTNFLSIVPSAAYFLAKHAHETARIVQDSWLSESGQRGVKGIIGGVSGFGFGALYVLIEGSMRDIYGKEYGHASIPGKIVSLPFDVATYVYDAAKKYFGAVGERIDKRKGDSDLEDNVKGGGE